VRKRKSEEVAAMFRPITLTSRMVPLLAYRFTKEDLRGGIMGSAEFDRAA
jgi:hypothetical protein